MLELNFSALAQASLSDARRLLWWSFSFLLMALSCSWHLLAIFLRCASLFFSILQALSFNASSLIRLYWSNEVSMAFILASLRCFRYNRSLRSSCSAELGKSHLSWPPRHAPAVSDWSRFWGDCQGLGWTLLCDNFIGIMGTRLITTQTQNRSL